MQAFISASRLDTSATISVDALAIALSMLVGNTVITIFSNNYDSPRVLIVMMSGITAAVIGIAAALYHVSWIACLLFISSGIVCGFLLPPLGLIEDMSKH